MAGLLDKLWKEGTLPTVETSVSIEDSTMIKLSLATILTALIIVLLVKVTKNA